MGRGEWMVIMYVNIAMYICILEEGLINNEHRTCVRSRELLKMVQVEFAFSIGTFILYI
jgi:hypothetical protein